MYAMPISRTFMKMNATRNVSQIGCSMRLLCSRLTPIHTKTGRVSAAGTVGNSTRFNAKCGGKLGRARKDVRGASRARYRLEYWL